MGTAPPAAASLTEATSVLVILRRSFSGPKQWQPPSSFNIKQSAQRSADTEAEALAGSCLTVTTSPLPPLDDAGGATACGCWFKSDCWTRTVKDEGAGHGLLIQRNGRRCCKETPEGSSMANAFDKHRLPPPRAHISNRKARKVGGGGGCDMREE